MNADNQMIEAIRNKNRQIEKMLERDYQHDTLSEEEEAEGEYDDQDQSQDSNEADNYYQQVKGMQLEDDEQEEDDEEQENMFYQHKFNHAQQQNMMNKADQYSYNQNNGYKQGVNVQIENQEEQHEAAKMKSKFENMQMENAKMFDDEERNARNQPQMEKIEEGYSSDDSFGAQMHRKNFKENMEFLMEENRKKEKKIKTKRNHINVKISQDNKENVNTRNKKLSEKHTAPEVNAVKRETVGLQRPGTAGMKKSNMMRQSLTRPQTIKSTKTKKRPSTAFMSTASTFNSKKSLKMKKSKKCDPVSRHQSMQNSWTKNKFLSK